MRSARVTLRADSRSQLPAVLFIGALIVVSFWMLRCFLAPAIWATMFVVTTWPMLRFPQADCPGR
jgi:predicted PurR-regulated permease PerM